MHLHILCGVNEDNTIKMQILYTRQKSPFPVADLKAFDIRKVLNRISKTDYLIVLL